ncbi:MAG: hypothetical protein VX962_11670, partial [Pseudomonadota bacterium]|nr:hypothetical protein [Pseudomonadota bacterium]
LLRPLFPFRTRLRSLNLSSLPFAFFSPVLIKVSWRYRTGKVENLNLKAIEPKNILDKMNKPELVYSDGNRFSLIDICGIVDKED